MNPYGLTRSRCSRAAVELAVLDLLGKVEGKPVAALFGEMRRTRVPVYASRFTVDEQGTGPVPDGPGWGITYDQRLRDRAVRL